MCVRRDRGPVLGERWCHRSAISTHTKQEWVEYRVPRRSTCRAITLAIAAPLAAPPYVRLNPVCIILRPYCGVHRGVLLVL